MPKFRKKPIVIEAWQWLGDQVEAPAWVLDYVLEGKKVNSVSLGDEFTSLSIPTLEGVTIASHGDWVIQGIAGELYACKPDIFAATYEAVD